MNDEKAIEQLEEFLVIDDWSAVYMPYLQDAIEYVINRIKALKERPQGEWTNTSPYDDKGECSLCCYLSKKYYKFCPNCGAVMKSEK